MILGFSQVNPKTKVPTGFVDKILSGQKIHTIRAGSRWQSGMPIQFATGVRTKNYHKFKDGIAHSIQSIKIIPNEVINDGKVFINARELDFTELQTLAWNDGFEHVVAFWTWFNEPFTGQLVHWTNYKY